jgi:hypothetical protein
MKSRIARTQTAKIATATAFASIFLANCNGQNYDNNKNNNADNAKAALLAQQAEEAAGNAGLGDTSWICNQQLSSNNCLGQEQIYISKDLKSVSQVMEIDQNDATAQGVKDQCFYSQDSTLDFNSSATASDFKASLIQGPREPMEVNGVAESAVCVNAYTAEEKQAAEEQAQEADKKHHKKHQGNELELAPNVLHVEFSLSSINGSNSELTVIETKWDKKNQKSVSITKVFVREQVLIEPAPMPSLPPEVLPEVVLASPSPSPSPAVQSNQQAK